MSRRVGLALLVFAVLAPAGKTRGQEAEPTVSAAEGVELRLEVLAQPQTSTTSVDSVVESDFELRRARLTAEGQAGERWSARIQMDFETERARFRDAYLEGRVSDGVSLRVGQFKVPFNGIELESAKRLLAIERASCGRRS